MMERLASSLNTVFKPRFNIKYFKRLVTHLDDLMQHRAKFQLDSAENLKKDITELIKLMDKADDRFIPQIDALERNIMPKVISIPNRYSKLVPSHDVTVDKLEFDFLSGEKLSKVLSHRKLSYINNCYTKSVVGPNSHYYLGIGAKLQHSLSTYFTKELERENFIPVSGLSLTKSALVEAANSIDSKIYSQDPCKILTNTHQNTNLHLVEASRESLLGFVSTIGHIASNDPLRLFTTGACYKASTSWFDGDESRVSQYETVHALILNSSIEQYSVREYNFFRDLIWSSYKKLQLPVRLIHCSLDSMFFNEYDAHRIDVWLPSRNEWIQVARISHYLDYLTIRVGMKRGHIIDSTVYDGQALVAAIIENRQTSSGRFIIPECLINHMIYLSKREKDEYTRISSSYLNGFGKVLQNYEQRRHLTKKSYVLSHSVKSDKLFKKKMPLMRTKMYFILIGYVITVIDWTELWHTYLPTNVKIILYDHIYRPIRRLFWNTIYLDPKKKPEDLTWTQIEKLLYTESTITRKKEALRALRRGDYGKETVQSIDAGPDQPNVKIDKC